MKPCNAINSRGSLPVNQEARGESKLNLGIPIATFVVCGLMVAGASLFLVNKHEALCREVDELKRQQQKLRGVLDDLQASGGARENLKTAKLSKEKSGNITTHRGDGQAHQRHVVHSKHNHAVHVRHLNTKILRGLRRKKRSEDSCQGAVLTHVNKSDGRQERLNQGIVQWTEPEHGGMVLNGGKIMIPCSGFYYVYAQLTFNGMRECDPARLYKPYYQVQADKKVNGVVLMEAFSDLPNGGCRDGRGATSSRADAPYFPLDAVYVGGVFYFDAWDEISVTIPRDSLKAVIDMNPKRSFFGAFKIP
ncbi:uncharacterized protein LOC106158423 [Lingula anatina]|uniref:Uncharacterized protein LOC106158423 n=1 Tax=Lingula anatina TaxID=7574 RepID=A0A1S3HXN1_LINAN|nr:uncharacterized protein LOC106158423 [Lingula anatina]|eukprot:XP_013389829.1 uncharacterized protein LOC106158423 [Lingula anatina]